MKIATLILLLFLAVSFGAAQTPFDGHDFNIALPEHSGQLRWTAPGFKIIETSAKEGGREVGIRGQDATAKRTFLAFLFLAPEQAPLTSVKCRDGAIESDMKDDRAMKVLSKSEITQPDSLPVAMVTYQAPAEGKTLHVVRGFVAAGDICGDLEFYSYTPIEADDPALKSIFSGLRLNSAYAPQFLDALFSAHILYEHKMFRAAAPVFEQALAMLPNDKSAETLRWTRVATDQAGMSYGIAGDTRHARKIFTQAIAKDPEYPIYYYMLACADAQEKNLADARVHLKQAFDRKANVVEGEAMPDPTQDDSFTPYRNDRDFWKFVQSLH